MPICPREIRSAGPAAGSAWAIAELGELFRMYRDSSCYLDGGGLEISSISTRLLARWNSVRQVRTNAYGRGPDPIGS